MRCISVHVSIFQAKSKEIRRDVRLLQGTAHIFVVFFFISNLFPLHTQIPAASVKVCNRLPVLVSSVVVVVERREQSSL